MNISSNSIEILKRYDDSFWLDVSHASTGRCQAGTHHVGATQNKLDCTFVYLHVRQDERIYAQQQVTHSASTSLPEPSAYHNSLLCQYAAQCIK